MKLDKESVFHSRRLESRSFGQPGGERVYLHAHVPVRGQESPGARSVDGSCRDLRSLERGCPF